MLTFADGTEVRTRKFASRSGTRTSNGTEPALPGGKYVEADWTRTSARILGKVTILRVCTDRPTDKPVWTGASERALAIRKAPKGWESV